MVSMVIHFSAAHFFISPFTNSFPVSILIHLGALPNFHSIFTTCSLIQLYASPLVYINFMLLFWVQLSINEICHFHFPINSIPVGPHTSDIILSPGVFDLFLASFGKGFHECLAWIQASHIIDGIVN